MVSSQPNSGLFVGLNKRQVVTKHESPPRPSDSKGFVRNVIREVADKCALRVAKQKLSTKLGTHKRAKNKREEMSNVLREMRFGGPSEKKKP